MPAIPLRGKLPGPVIEEPAPAKSTNYATQDQLLLPAPQTAVLERTNNHLRYLPAETRIARMKILEECYRAGFKPGSTVASKAELTVRGAFPPFGKEVLGTLKWNLGGRGEDWKPLRVHWWTPSETPMITEHRRTDDLIVVAPEHINAS